jgi:AcrR family transcriptional regulator
MDYGADMTASARSDGSDPGEELLGPSVTPREAQLLTTTLEVLGETGYDKFTVDEVVARAHASKTTVYRRWPSKAELVCAAFAYRIRGEHTLPPDRGSLRADLLELGEIIARDAEEYGRTIAGILAAGERSPQLRQLLVDDLRSGRKGQVHGVLHRAVARGEIRPEVISDDLWDLMPAYITFRVLQHNQPVPADTLRALVDEVLIPSLTRPPVPRA